MTTRKGFLVALLILSFGVMVSIFLYIHWLEAYHDLVRETVADLEVGMDLREVRRVIHEDGWDEELVEHTDGLNSRKLIRTKLGGDGSMITLKTPGGAIQGFRNWLVILDFIDSKLVSCQVRTPNGIDDHPDTAPVDLIVDELIELDHWVIDGDSD